jgi:hypothetical protein
MIPDEIDVPHAAGRACSRRPASSSCSHARRRHRAHLRRAPRLSRGSDDPVRHEQVGSIMAEMYGRLTRQAGVVMGQGSFWRATRCSARSRR